MYSPSDLAANEKGTSFGGPRERKREVGFPHAYWSHRYQAGSAPTINHAFVYRDTNFVVASCPVLSSHVAKGASAHRSLLQSHRHACNLRLCHTLQEPSIMSNSWRDINRSSRWVHSACPQAKRAADSLAASPILPLPEYARPQCTMATMQASWVYPPSGRDKQPG